MPIETNFVPRTHDQADFGRVAYEVVGLAYRIRDRIGRKFDESVYRGALAHLLASRAHQQAHIRLSHRGFKKDLFMDLLVDRGCPFELKVATDLHDRHRAQLIQYLMLTNLRHGKLINFGGESLQHEFVNCHEESDHRRGFVVDIDAWPASSSEARVFQEVVVNLLRDWGTGLDRGTYLDAITFLLGGPDTVMRPVDVFWDGAVVGQQFVRMLTVGTAFEITCSRFEQDAQEAEVRRVLENTTVRRLFWVNIVSGIAKFTELVTAADRVRERLSC